MENITFELGFPQQWGYRTAATGFTSIEEAKQAAIKNHHYIGTAVYEVSRAEDELDYKMVVSPADMWQKQENLYEDKED